MKKWISLAICVLVGVLFWFSPTPEGVTPQAWHLLSIFLFTILGIIIKPLPMGAMALVGLMLTVLTKTLTFAEAFSGFQNDVVWLVAIAFFISRGIITSGLGARIAYHLIAFLGKNSIGLGYGMAMADLVLAPVIPSTTARAGGVILPILKSISKAFHSEPHNAPKKIGAYLTQTAFQATCITSAMFLTAMAGNPLIADIVERNGFEISWGKWALAAFVPGIINLLVLPLFLYKIYPPEIKETPEAKKFAHKNLKEMGKLCLKEWIIIGVFILLITLWILGPSIGLKAATAALLGLVCLLFTRVLSWSDILKEDGGWDVLIWFSTLVMMASFLSKLGLADWFSNMIVSHVQGYNWMIGFSFLALIYFYTHYFFASNIAQIGAMFPPFFMLSLALGTPPMLAVFVLGCFSSLFGGLTHYGCGPAPILFGTGYVKITEWWRLGFMVSVLNILIWVLVGVLWWKIIGLF